MRSRVAGSSFMSTFWSKRKNSPVSRCATTSRNSSASTRRPSCSLKANSRMSTSVATMVLALPSSVSSKTQADMRSGIAFSSYGESSAAWMSGSPGASASSSGRSVAPSSGAK